MFTMFSKMVALAIIMTLVCLPCGAVQMPRWDIVDGLVGTKKLIPREPVMTPVGAGWLKALVLACAFAFVGCASGGNIVVAEPYEVTPSNTTEETLFSTVGLSTVGPVAEDLTSEETALWSEKALLRERRGARKVHQQAPLTILRPVSWMGERADVVAKFGDTLSELCLGRGVGITNCVANTLDQGRLLENVNMIIAGRQYSLPTVLVGSQREEPAKTEQEGVVATTTPTTIHGNTSFEDGIIGGGMQQNSAKPPEQASIPPETRKQDQAETSIALQLHESLHREGELGRENKKLETENSKKNEMIQLLGKGLKEASFEGQRISELEKSMGRRTLLTVFLLVALIILLFGLYILKKRLESDRLRIRMWVERAEELRLISEDQEGVLGLLETRLARTKQENDTLTEDRVRLNRQLEELGDRVIVHEFLNGFVGVFPIASRRKSEGKVFALMPCRNHVRKDKIKAHVEGRTACSECRKECGFSEERAGDGEDMDQTVVLGPRRVGK